MSLAPIDHRAGHPRRATLSPPPDSSPSLHHPGLPKPHPVSHLQRCTWRTELIPNVCSFQLGKVRSFRLGLTLTTEESGPAPGNRKKETEIFWHPEWMLHEAARLGQVVERLDTPEKGHPVRFDRSSIAVPVLLALAIELALKALQWNERDGGQPTQTHDLPVLFKGLKKDTRERIEANMPEIPGILPELPRRPGIRTALCRARNVFVDWRYPYEHPGLIVQTADLKTALKAILAAHPVQVVRGPTLGNQRRCQ